MSHDLDKIPTLQMLIAETELPDLSNQEALALFAAAGSRPVFVKKPSTWNKLRNKGLLDFNNNLTELGKRVIIKLNEKKTKEKKEIVSLSKLHLTE